MMCFATDLGAVIGEGVADWDLEAFLTDLQVSCQLDALRLAAARAALRRKAAVLAHDDSLSVMSEADDSDRWTCSNTDGASTCTDSEWLNDKDLESVSTPGASGRWGLKGFVGGTGRKGSAKADRGAGLASDSYGSLSSLEASDRDDLEDSFTAVDDSDLEEFLGELEQDEKLPPIASGWRLVMNRSTRKMKYCSWFRDPGSRGGTEYRGRMVISGIKAEVARDFMLDEMHRAEWDENRALSEPLEDWDENGCTAVRWVRRLPFFLSNREYVISRRVWNPEYRTFFCISRHTNHPSAPRRPGLIRVSSFYSSWRIRPISVEGCADEAVEVVTHHEEQSGLQRDLARMGVARGMWAHILKMEKALQAYAAGGRNAKHLLPVFLIQADARNAGMQNPPLPPLLDLYTSDSDKDNAEEVKV